MPSLKTEVEVKLPKELKDLAAKLPDNFPARLEECERVLEELCERGGIAFNKPVSGQSRERERVLRNVKSE